MKEKSFQQEIECTQDSPDYRLFFGALENLYPGTPLADDIAGTRDSISDITIDNLHENFDLFCHPSQNALISDRKDSIFSRYYKF